MKNFLLNVRLLFLKNILIIRKSTTSFINKKRLFSFFVVTLFLFEVITFSACSNQKTNKSTATKDSIESYTSFNAKEDGSMIEKNALNHSSLEEKESKEDSIESIETFTDSLNRSGLEEKSMILEDSVSNSITNTNPSLEKTADSTIDSDSSDIVPTPSFEPVSGSLTAGSWNDNENWGFFSNLVKTQNFTLPSYGINPIFRFVVHVKDKNQPVADAHISLLDTSYSILWECVSDYSGTAYVFYPAFNTSDASNTIPTPAFIKVEKAGKEVIQKISLSNTSNQDGQGVEMNSIPQPLSDEVTLSLDNTSLPKKLDLMFVFDTTASMTDELLYLQKEFESIAQQTLDENSRVSVNFYRDEDDDYVIKPHEFTNDIQTISSILNSESADGGGDFEEAVEQALENAILDHTWETDSTKLLFLILDAPPHISSATNASLKKSITEAARQGIRIIPIASSGIDKQTEFFLRTITILTGGTYVFLTDDSGIGASHLEPTIGSYKVELLNDCIVRLIQLYYNGI